MTQEDHENHKDNLKRINDNLQKIAAPKVVILKHYKIGREIKKEILRRMSFGIEAQGS